MSRQSWARLLCWLLPIVGLASLLVFGISLVYDLQTGEMLWFELAARIIGYLLTLAVAVLSMIAAAHCARRGFLGDAARVAAGIVLAVVVFLCIHDVLLFAAEGNQLPGTFPMAAFFGLDIGLLAAYLLIVGMLRKRPEHPALRVALIVAAALWGCYMIADMAGYPTATIPDWDEAVLKFLPLCHACLLLLLPIAPPKAAE